MSMFGWGVGDIATISTLAVKVYTAYKDAPDNYRHISEEVESLQILINKAVRHIKSTMLSDEDREEGRKVLKGCQSILLDLNSLIDEYKRLAPTSKGKVFKRVKFGGEDIATLRSRLTSNTVLLNGFTQSCEMQARLTEVFGLHRTSSRVSLDSVTSFAGSINTKKAYKKFCKGLFRIGVTADMICQNEEAIHNIFRPQNTATSSQIDDVIIDNQMDGITIEDQSQLPVEGGVEISPQAISTDGNTLIQYKQSRFDWVRPPIDFLVGPLMHAAAEEGNTKRLISILRDIRNIDFENDYKQTALHRAVCRGHLDIVELLLGKGASTEVRDQYQGTPLHAAARGGHTGIVELLLGKGSSTEAMNTTKDTPLHLAARGGHTGIVELLLGKGASTEARDGHQHTPLHLAVWGGHTGTVELLLGKGASTEAMNHVGLTPLDIRCRDS